MKKHLILATTALAIAACSDATGPEATNAARPAADHAAHAAAAESVQIQIDAPAGRYRLDPTHASLDFSVTHLGVSNYVMRFTDFDVVLDLDPDDLSASSVSVTIDPASIRTDYAGDYKATHPDSPFAGWDEDLAKSEHFLNAGAHPSIRFTSTSVTPGGDGTLHVNGELEMLGQTRPVTLQTSVVGSEQAHPFTGVGLIGFSASGSFKRSDFGMTHLLTPPIVGDTVTLRFEGELLQEQDGNDG